MVKNSDYSGSDVSRSTQNFPEGTRQIIFKDWQACSEAVYRRRNWNALKYSKIEIA